MTEAMVIDVDAMSTPETNSAKKCLKRKRVSVIECMSKEDREARMVALREEMSSLFRYFGEILEERKRDGEDLGVCGNSLIACLLEESRFPLSKLVDEIYEKVKEKESGVSVASVRSSVLLIGQRSFYGLANVNADVLEDDSEACLWCWETRDIKLIPKSMRGALKIWRTCRKKIQERITAISAMISALEKADNDQTCKQELTKASERLGKVLSETDIRLLIGSMVQKIGADMAEKGGKREQNLLIKQMEKNKREAEKQKKRFELELQKEKLQSEKELKRLQDEAEKEEKRREKEEYELRKQLKKQQEEAERDQRRREKEEAELKKQLALQKQATLMERFLKKSKNSPPSQKMPSPAEIKNVDLPRNKATEVLESVTLSMDSILSQCDATEAENLWKLHLNSWRCSGHSIRTDRKQHWGIRRIPKTELIKELKLTGTEEYRDEELITEKLADGLGETNSNCKDCHTNIDDSIFKNPNRRRMKQLLQFDKSPRPAFYGTWPKESKLIKPRRPLVKDPDLDYEIDSDEEWEEEEPGESLSDCDKDDEEEILEDGPSKAEEEDDSEDGFFVPDGYLSENEGVQDKMESDEDSVQAANRVSSCKQVDSEELSVFFRQQKYLHNLTENALRKSRPLIISNLLHEKVIPVLNGASKGTSELEQACLLALGMRALPGYPSIEISLNEDVQDVNLEASPSSNKGKTTPVANTTDILDSDLSEMVPIIQSNSQGINKVVNSLHQKFPDISKSQLRTKVREISHYTDNRWQVKKDVLNKLGMSPSPTPENSKTKTKNIASFFSKRCLPPEGKTENHVEASSTPPTDQLSNCTRIDT
ncbi:Chromatin assembly factor 1 subunit A [Heracleum sosnowskyi]|uniref:Chromatin assembly factor 1 subunit A n=1 Tax=Heracleum sosnowskyi TaxID=360622 RepID=A0AAD8JHR4_9APIA|nr:Chromatin assembly factor 1 subunit A [Heracleum sosnowskyi]